MDKTKKIRAGFTLMEAVIALAIWMLLFSSALVIWHNASRHKEILLERQSYFENARGAMDILLVNMQMARSIDLRVRPGDYVLRSMYLPGYCARSGRPHTFRFYFDIYLWPVSDRFQRLETGGEDGTLSGRNEVASNIAAVHIRPVAGRYMLVTLKTSCDHQFVLEGSVDIRYRQVLLNGVLQ